MDPVFSRPIMILASLCACSNSSFATANSLKANSTFATGLQPTHKNLVGTRHVEQKRGGAALHV